MILKIPFIWKTHPTKVTNEIFDSCMHEFAMYAKCLIRNKSLIANFTLNRNALCMNTKKMLLHIQIIAKQFTTFKAFDFFFMLLEMRVPMVFHQLIGTFEFLAANITFKFLFISMSLTQMLPQRRLVIE